jgi:hypothetical protein
VLASDLTSDGKPDLAVLSRSTGRLLLLPNIAQ